MVRPPAKVQEGGTGRTPRMTLTHLVSDLCGYLPSCCTFTSAEISTHWPNESHQESERSKFDRSKLPSAPRASTAAEIDMSRLPSRPPYTVYLGNLSYECSESDIAQLFERKKLKVCLSTLKCTPMVLVWFLCIGSICAVALRNWYPTPEGLWICRV